METWTFIPPLAARRIVKGVKEMEVVRHKNLEEIVNWRDKMLIKLLKVVREEQAKMNIDKPGQIVISPKSE
jgi:hypothetical protein